MAGYLALDSLRLEKGYRHLGHDMGPSDDPASTGLGFAVAWGKDADFTGRRALTDRASESLSMRAVHLSVDDPEVRLWGEETVYVGEEPVGRVTSGAFGYSLGRSVGIALVSSAADLEEGAVSVRVRGVRHAATASRKPFYDPGNARVRG